MQGGSGKAGGQIVMYSRDPYFGRLSKLSGADVELLGTWVKKADLKELGMLNVNFNGTLKVNAVLEKANIDKFGIKNTQREQSGQAPDGVYGTLQRNYTLDNGDIEQFPALAGVMVIRPKAVKVLNHVLEGLHRSTGGKSTLWDKIPYMQMTSDVINNLIKNFKNKRMDDEDYDSDMIKYLHARMTQDDIKDQYNGDRVVIRNNFEKLYSLFTEVGHRDLTATAILAPKRRSLFVHIMQQTDTDRVIGMLQDGGFPMDLSQAAVAADNSQALNEVRASRGPDQDGGLDLSGARDAVEFRDGGLPASDKAGLFDAAHASQFLQLFRGFDFKIIGLQPIENPINFLSR